MADERSSLPRHVVADFTLSSWQLQSSLLASAIPVGLADLTGRCLMANDALGELLGMDAEKVVGLSVEDLMPPDDVARARDRLGDRLSGRRMEPASEHRLMRPDGRVVTAAISTIVLREHDGTPQYLMVLMRDLKTSGVEEQRLSRRLRQQSAVAELGRSAIAGHGSLEDLIDSALQAVLDTLGVSGAVGELLPGGEEFRVRGSATGPLNGERMPLAGSLSQAVLKSRAPVVIRDGADARVDSPILREHGITSAVAVIVGRYDEPFGTLGVATPERVDFTEDDVHFLSAVANVIAEGVRRERADAQLRWQALHDPVTGLPNRTLLKDRLQQSVEVSRRAGARLGVIFVDLDHFKVINDSLGHQAGDEVLRTVAHRFGSALRRTDTVARFGGDEFVFVVPVIDGERDAMRIAETIQSLLDPPIPVAGQTVHVRASIGICVSSPGDGTDPERLIRDADAALYRAKARGRGRYELVLTESQQPPANRLVIEQDLRHALAVGDLRMAFQPVVRMTDGTTIGAEALLRWQHPSNKYLRPAEFLDVAEQSGLIVAIGEWMLRSACRHAARWSADRDFLLTINMSASQLGDRGVVDAVAGALEASGLAPGRLGLELTEHVLIKDELDAHHNIESLKALGVKLLLDDFGTGFSSLSHLKRFPIDVVKIDRSFVEGLGSGDGDDTAIVSAIVGMSRATGKQVIPEGVETATQVRELRRLGCELGQGYLFARPMTAGDLTAFLESAPREAA